MEFIKSLFDVSFTRFITPTIAGIVLIVEYAIETLVALSIIIGSAREGIGAAFASLILTAIFLPIAIITTRIWMEGLVAIIKIAQETTMIRKDMESNKPKA